MPTRSLASPKMSAAISATVRSSPTANTEAGPDASSQVSGNVSRTLTNGVAASEANRAWQVVSRTLAKGVSLDIDLYDFAGIDAGSGAGNDPVGQAMTPIEKIVGILIVNENAIASVGRLDIDVSIANGATWFGNHTVATGGDIRGQGWVQKCQPHLEGFDLTDASNQIVRLTASGADVNFSMYILGRNDDNESSSSQSSSASSASSSSSTSSASSSSSSSSISTSSVSSASSTSSSSESSSSSSISTSSASSSSSSISTSTSSSPG